MLIVRVLGDCPQCGGARTYGNVQVNSAYVLRGCAICTYEEWYPLPELRSKKVLYLDQNFFSAAFRHMCNSKKGQPELIRLMARIKKLASAQLLAIPLSSIHEREIQRWMLSDDALDFLKVTSRGHEFERHYKIERTQMLNAFHAWIEGGPSDYKINQKEALSSRVHDWDGYFFVDVKIDQGISSRENEGKIESAKNLIGLFDGWRNDNSKFNDDFLKEIRGQANIYFYEYLNWLDSKNIFKSINPPILAHAKITILENYQIDDAIEIMIKFLVSEHFLKIPLHSITCSSHVALKHEVMSGAYSNREKSLKNFKGYYDDLDHIAHYAPYCDAIAVDKAMSEILRKPGVSLESRYEVKVFSLSNVADFDRWLDGIENSVSAEHKEALREVYGFKF